MIQVHHQSNAVERTLITLGIDRRMQTDPALLADILLTDMRLHDFASFTGRLGEKLTHPQKLETFIDAVQTGIERQHPAISEFLDEALAAGLVWTPDAQGTQMINPLFPASGPATGSFNGSFNGLHQKANS